MPGIENIIRKILEEAGLKSEEILESAVEEEKKIIDKKIIEARSEAAVIIDKVKSEVVNRKDRIISGAQLKVRNEKLSAKQNIISKVFDMSLESLKLLPKTEYLSFVKKKIIDLDITGDEKMIISKKDEEVITADFILEVNKALIEIGKAGKIYLDKEKRNFSGGFILEKDGVEINNTFEALLNSMHSDLEYEVARVLFD